jgi:hypothetical protein
VSNSPQPNHAAIGTAAIPQAIQYIWWPIAAVITDELYLAAINSLVVVASVTFLMADVSAVRILRKVNT